MSKNEKIFLIYVYEIDKHVYIGLTKNIVKRHASHNSKIINDSIYQFCKENGCVNIPEPKILETGLTWIEAQAKEDDWINYYRDNGYVILNRAQTGIYRSSVGSYQHQGGHTGNISKIKKTKLTYDICYETAKKYSSKKEFKMYDFNVYAFAKKNEWVKDYTWLKTENIDKVTVRQCDITYEDYTKSASECKTKTEFSLKYPQYYKWGLKRELNDKFFVKELKTKYVTPNEYSNLTFEGAIDLIRNHYQTRTELNKNNRRLYEYCRHMGWLKQIFNSKNIDNNSTKWIYRKVSRCNINEIATENLLKIPTFKNLFIDVENCKIYKKLKKKINEVTPSIDSSGMLYYSATKENGDKKTFAYHKYLRLALGYDDFNCVEYIDGDYSNIARNNLRFYKYDTSEIKQIHTYYNNYIDKYGNVYDSVDEILNKGVKKINDRKYIGQYAIDNLVYSKFVHPIKETVSVEHRDGIMDNNNFENLFVKQEIINDIEIIAGEEKYTIYLYDENGEKYLVGKLWSDTVVGDIKRKLNEYIRKGLPVKAWINDFKENVYSNMLKLDRKLYADKVRTESSGCYWFESRKCWKSKIYYNNKEWSLGYFDCFEHGKMLYEIAAIAIKYDYFETWYENIKTERKIIKSCKKHEPSTLFT